MARSAASIDAVKEAPVIQLIHTFRERGHLLAQLDPLGTKISYNAELDPLTYGLSMWDLDREFYTSYLGGGQRMEILRDILEQLRQTYCGKIACEYMHIQDTDQKKWLQERMEAQANNWPLSREIKLGILRNLLDAEEFEHFLHARYIGQKRFSLEGAETAIPIVDAIVARAADDNVHEVVMGMAHRGRLNILANVVGKTAGADLLRVRGEPRSFEHPGVGRREIPCRRERRAAYRRNRVARSRCRWLPTRAIWKPWIRWSKESCGPSRTVWAIASAPG